MSRKPAVSIDSVAERELYSNRFARNRESITCLHAAAFDALSELSADKQTCMRLLDEAWKRWYRWPAYLPYRSKKPYSTLWINEIPWIDMVHWVVAAQIAHHILKPEYARLINEHYRLTT
jgi:hypothetical protein